MSGGTRIWKHITEGDILPGDILPGLPIVEITGEHRILVENHMGIKEYSRERISIKVKYGTVVICGSCLKLIQMTKEQLVISGVIDGISLIRRQQI